MALYFNEQRFTGRVTTEPEIKVIHYNNKVNDSTTVGFAIKDDRGEDAGFINITLWGTQAANFVKMVNKGTLLYVETRLKSRYDGQKRTTYFSFDVTRWNFLESRQTVEAREARNSQPAGYQAGYQNQAPVQDPNQDPEYLAYLAAKQTKATGGYGNGGQRATVPVGSLAPEDDFLIDSDPAVTGGGHKPSAQPSPFNN